MISKVYQSFVLNELTITVLIKILFNTTHIFRVKTEILYCHCTWRISIIQHLIIRWCDKHHEIPLVYLKYIISIVHWPSSPCFKEVRVRYSRAVHFSRRFCLETWLNIIFLLFRVDKTIRATSRSNAHGLWLGEIRQINTYYRREALYVRCEL